MKTFCSFGFVKDKLSGMKRKYYILGTLALLCLLCTGYYVWTLYDAHYKQVAEWNEGAKAAFEEALWMEVNKRAEVPFYSTSSGDDGMTTFKERVPDSVFVTSLLGRRGYRIERNKYNHSLVKDTRKRVRLTTLFAGHPLSTDTLLIHWDSLLFANQIPIKGQVRYIYTDLDLQNDTVYSDSSNHLGLDSLTVKYLGFRCEHELTAYVSYPSWLHGLTRYDGCVLLLPWLFWLLLFICYPKLEVFVLRKVTNEKVIEKEVIVEKEIHVADVQINKADVYQLPDGSLFDSFSGTLVKDGISKQLPPQSVLLLKLFLRKDNHRLSTNEIEQELWNGQGSADKIHKAIQRLRSELKKSSSDLVVKNVNGDYELK